MVSGGLNEDSFVELQLKSFELIIYIFTFSALPFIETRSQFGELFIVVKPQNICNAQMAIKIPIPEVNQQINYMINLSIMRNVCLTLFDLLFLWRGALLRPDLILIEFLALSFK